MRTINIIIPTVKSLDHFVLPELLRSIEEQSIYKHNIILIEDEVKRKPNTSVYDRMEETIEKGKDDNNLYMIANSDMIFGYEWDLALLNCYYNNCAGIVSMSNVCDLTVCGWPGNTSKFKLEECGAEKPKWCSLYPSKELYDQFQIFSEEKRKEHRGKILNGYNFVPFLLSKCTFFDILGQFSYSTLGDVDFFHQAKHIGVKLLIAVDSICYHYVAFSTR